MTIQDYHQEPLQTLAKIQFPAPPFEADACFKEEFKKVNLGQFKGKYLVLFFYPLGKGLQRVGIASMSVLSLGYDMVVCVVCWVFDPHGCRDGSQKWINPWINYLKPIQ